MATSLSLGMQQLQGVSELTLKQKPRGLHGNKFEVATSKGDVIFMAKEDSTALMALLGGKERAFHMNIYDTQDNLMFSLRRPHTFGVDKMEVFVDNALACIVRQQPTWMTPVLHINDFNDSQVLRLKGESCKRDFKLETASKKQIGSITHNYKGFWKEVMTTLDTFDIQFPADLDVRYKAAVIGSCVLIDYLYHEH